MIDLHCHLLPGIDDGPATMSEALQLAEQAVEDGVTHSVVTPHIHKGRWSNEAANIADVVGVFRERLVEEGIPLFVGYAAEVRIGIELIPMIERHRIPFLGEWNDEHVLLLELPHSHIPTGTQRVVSWLLKNNIRPMIAHPERNKDVMRNITKLSPLIELGCLFQVTAGSVAGQFGEKAQVRARELLEMGVVTILASDAHHPKTRPVNLLQGYQAAKDLVGETEALKLVRQNPVKLVKNFKKFARC